MKIETQDYGSVAIVSLDGELDLDSIDTFTKSLEPLVVQYDKGVVLDLSNVSFVDSKGLESLLWLRDRCLTVGTQMKLAGLDDNCSRILKITRLDKSFDCYEELASAVRSYA